MKNTIISILVLLAFAGGTIWLIKTPGKGGKLDQFATCIANSGAKFYGAFWCPHCRNQKAEFGSSAKLLPYVECSTPDGNSQLQVCTDQGIKGYPTWKFGDGTEKSGEVSLADLSIATKCPLPQ